MKTLKVFQKHYHTHGINWQNSSIHRAMADAIRKSGRRRWQSHCTSNLTTLTHDSTYISIVIDMLLSIEHLQHAFLTPLYFNAFVICEFNFNLHEIFTESLELDWINACALLWHYLQSFSLVRSVYLYIYIYIFLYLYISISIYLYLYIYFYLFVIISSEYEIILKCSIL